MPSVPSKPSKKAPAVAPEEGVSPLASEPTADLASLVDQDAGAVGGEPSPPAESTPEVETPPAPNPETSAAEERIAELEAALDTEREARALAEAEVTRLKAEVADLTRQMTLRPVAPIPAAITPAARPSTVPSEFVLTRWKGPGTYEGRCYSLTGEVLPRARGALTGWFPRRMVEKVSEQFEKV